MSRQVLLLVVLGWFVICSQPFLINSNIIEFLTTEIKIKHQQYSSYNKYPYKSFGANSKI